MVGRNIRALLVAFFLTMLAWDAAGQATRISGLIQPLGNIRATSFQTTPNGLNTVFIADADTDQTDELYVVPAGGGARVKISAAIPTGPVVSFKLTPDSNRAVFLVQTSAVPNRFELYAVSLDGSQLHNLSGAIVAGGSLFNAHLITSDSTRVVFYGNKDSTTQSELYSVSITGGGTTKLNSTMLGDVQFGFTLSPDSTRAVYYANADNFNVVELYSAVVTAAGAPIKLSGTIVAGGNVTALFDVSADSSRVVFRADKDTDNKIELYATNSGGLVMDIDGNGVVDALTDGLLLIRWQFGLKGPGLIANAIGPNATRNTAALVEAYLTKLDTAPGP